MFEELETPLSQLQLPDRFARWANQHGVLTVADLVLIAPDSIAEALDDKSDALEVISEEITRFLGVDWRAVRPQLLSHGRLSDKCALSDLNFQLAQLPRSERVAIFSLIDRCQYLSEDSSLHASRESDADVSRARRNICRNDSWKLEATRKLSGLLHDQGVTELSRLAGDPYWGSLASRPKMIAVYCNFILCAGFYVFRHENRVLLANLKHQEFDAAFRVAAALLFRLRHPHELRPRLKAALPHLAPGMRNAIARMVLADSADHMAPENKAPSPEGPALPRSVVVPFELSPEIKVEIRKQLLLLQKKGLDDLLSCVMSGLKERVAIDARSQVSWMNELGKTATSLFEVLQTRPASEEVAIRIAAALAYYVDVDDVIPDHTPGKGSADDAFAINQVVPLALKLCRSA